jgi:hypothetical protein
MNDHNQETVTVGMFTQAMEKISINFEKAGSRIDSLDTKMMEGFSAFDKRINLVETNLTRSIQGLSNQIQHLVMSKADWPEEA